MVDFGLLDFGKFGVFLQCNGKVVDRLFITAIDTIRLSDVIMRGHKSIFRLPMNEDHQLANGLDVHPHFQQFLR